MKTHLPETLQAPGGPVRKDRRGVALITVLTFVALTTILMMTFFLMAQNEHQASRNYSEGLQAQEVAESAVNLVIAQIREATAQSNRLWASQPGAIRTWSASGADKFDVGYKLYSDDQMVVKGGSEQAFATKDFEELAKWSTQPAAYVDLNEPVIRGEKVYYPIVDPLAADFPKWPNLASGGTRKGDDKGIEGFSYDTGHTAVGINDFGRLVQTKTNAHVKANYDALPMPVRWLYQLKDGALGYVSDDGNGGGDFHLLTAGSPGVSAENPIVARFAFWADDETCKLNVNYHAGGATWNTPLTGGDIDRNDGGKQPIKGEYQRYSGHPASTHVAPVIIPGIVNITNDRQSIEALYKMVPRIVGGGSEFGTKAFNIAVTGAKSIETDRDRLYASVDEMLFSDAMGTSSQRELNEFPTAGGRIGTKGERSPDEIKDQLERMRFFLTVSSRAPEVNYMNRPRISMWPTYEYKAPSELGYQTAFDRLIRFCSEMGVTGAKPNKYYLERRNEDDMLYDYESIPRNKEIYAYMDWLTKQDIPGYGKSFDSKLGKSDRLQLLTQIFDYIRSTNLYDDSLFFNGSAQQFTDKNSATVVTYTNPRSKSTDGLHPGFGQVTPIRINYDGVETQGFGRFQGLQEIGTLTICCAEAGDLAGFPQGCVLAVPKEYGGVYPGRIDSGTEEYEKNRMINQTIPVTPDNINEAEFSNFPPLYEGIVPRPHTDRREIPFPSTPDANAFNNMMRTWPHWLKLLYTKYGTHDVSTPPDQIGDGLFTAAGIPATEFKRASAEPIRSPKYMEADIIFPEEVKKAFDVQRWNWQLAMLDSTYESLIWTNGLGRYDRKLLTKIDSSSVPDWTDPLIFNSVGERSRLQPGQKLLQSALIFDLSGNMLGYNSIHPDINIDIEVTNVSFQSLYGPQNLPGGSWYSNGRSVSYGDHGMGGVKSYQTLILADEKGPLYTPQAIDSGRGTSGGAYVSGRSTLADTNYLGIAGVVPASKKYNRYPYVTKPYAVGGTQFVMSGGEIKFKIYSAGTNDAENKNSAPKGPRQLVQEIELDVPRYTADLPKLAPPSHGVWLSNSGGGSGGLNAMSRWSLGFEGASGEVKEYDFPGKAPYGRMALCESGYYGGLLAVKHKLGAPGDPDNFDVCRGIGVRAGDSRIASIRPKIQRSDKIYAPHYDYDKADVAIAMFNGGSDVAERKIVSTIQEGTRLIYSEKAKDVQWYGDFDNATGSESDGAYCNKPDEGNLTFISGNTTGGIHGNIPYFSDSWTHTAVTPSYFTPNRIVCSPVAFGSLPRRAISGNSWETLLFRPNNVGGLYRSHPGAESPPDHLLLDLFWMPVVEPFAISEPLSTGGKVNLNQDFMPFRHITRDTALLGVFKSEYLVIIPDLWTGRYKSKYGWGNGWHWRDNPYGGELVGISLRATIEPTATLDQFHEKFKAGKIFKTASEICDIHLVPISIGESQQGGRDNGIRTPHWKQMGNGTYWSINRATGDNAKEKPYNNIYPRVTTKSNTFKVHFRAQILSKAKADVVAPNKFDPEIDQVVAEYRGSSIVERYVEPNDPDIPDYASASSTSGSSGSTADSLDKFYKFRVVNPTRFAP